MVSRAIDNKQKKVFKMTDKVMGLFVKSKAFTCYKESYWAIEGGELVSKKMSTSVPGLAGAYETMISNVPTMMAPMFAVETIGAAYCWAKEGFVYDTAAADAYLEKNKPVKSEPVDRWTALGHARSYLSDDSNEDFQHYLMLLKDNQYKSKSLKEHMEDFRSSWRLANRVSLVFWALLPLFSLAFYPFLEPIIGKPLISVPVALVMSVFIGVEISNKEYDGDVEKQLMYVIAKLRAGRVSSILLLPELYANDIKKLSKMITLLQLKKHILANEELEDTALKDLYDTDAKKVHPLVKAYFDAEDKDSIKGQIIKLDTDAVARHELDKITGKFRNFWFIRYCGLLIKRRIIDQISKYPKTFIVSLILWPACILFPQTIPVVIALYLIVKLYGPEIQKYLGKKLEMVGNKVQELYVNSGVRATTTLLDPVFVVKPAKAVDIKLSDKPDFERQMAVFSTEYSAVLAAPAA